MPTHCFDYPKATTDAERKWLKLKLWMKILTFLFWRQLQSCYRKVRPKSKPTQMANKLKLGSNFTRSTNKVNLIIKFNTKSKLNHNSVFLSWTFYWMRAMTLQFLIVFVTYTDCVCVSHCNNEQQLRDSGETLKLLYWHHRVPLCG